MKAMIFDIDGTLCDVSKIAHWVDDDFDRWQNETAFCPPVGWVAQEVKNIRELEPQSILIGLTMRDATWFTLTNNWLKDNGIELDYTIFRTPGDFRPSFIVKEEALDKLQRSGYTIDRVFEDDPRNIQMFRRRGIETYAVEGFGWF